VTAVPGTLALVLGGARSGKSVHAESLAMRGSRVLYVATAQPGDDEMARRIAMHRERRNPAWDTLEEPLELVAVLPEALRGYDTCLIECLTLWVSNLLLAETGDGTGPYVAEDRVVQQAHDLLDLQRRSSANWIVVSNEVGSGVVPATSLGRVYRDTLGRVNAAFAGQAGEVLLTVAGLAIDVKALAQSTPGAQ